MKKKNKLIGSTLGFLAVLLGETYCLLNFKGDYIVVIGVGIVLLCMAYLLLDIVLDYGKEETEEDKLEQEALKSLSFLDSAVSGQNDSEEESEAEKVQKGMYMLQKRGFAALEQELAAGREQEIKTLASLQEELSVLMKTEMKYERENAKQIIHNSKKKPDQVTSYMEQMSRDLQKEMRDVREAVVDSKNEAAAIGVAMKEYQLTVEALRQQVMILTDVLRHMDSNMANGPVYSMPVYKEMTPGKMVGESVNISTAPASEASVSQVEDSVLDDSIAIFDESAEEMVISSDFPAEESIEEEAPVDELFVEELTEDVAMAEEVLVEEPSEEMAAEELAVEELAVEVSDIEGIPDEIAIEESVDEMPVTEDVMLEEIAVEEPVVEEPSVGVEELNLDAELSELMPELDVLMSEPELVVEPEPVVESAPEPEPAPMPVISGDPNKPLSPEEIAALFASMGQ